MPLLEETLASIAPPDPSFAARAREYQDTLTMPRGALGRVQELAQRLCAIQRRMPPTCARKRIVVVAADHGVATEGVSAFPQAVTAQMVANFARGGAAINVFARAFGAEVAVVDAGVASDLSALVCAGQVVDRKIAPGTASLLRGPAMTRDQARRALENGIELAAAAARDGVDLLAAGDMGIGNTTPSAAIAAVFTGRDVDALTGRGTGLDDAGVRRKSDVIRRALAANAPDPRDPLDVLAKVGGFEIGTIAGLALGAAAAHVPYLVDGVIATAGALVAAELCPALRECLIAAHESQEPAHRAMLERLDLRPLLALDLRLGEGTGAALALPLCEAACRIMAEMATFAKAGVSDKPGG